MGSGNWGAFRWRIARWSGKHLTINYLMRRSDAGWRITDIYLDSTISQLAVYHSQFQSILDEEGVDGLVMALNRKTDLLGGNATGP